MARGRRFAGITAVALVAVAMVVGASRLHASVSTVPNANVLEASVVHPAEMAAVTGESQVDGWARSGHRRHTGVGNRILLGLLASAAAVTIVLLLTGSVPSDRREPVLRAWRAGYIRRRAPPLRTSA